MKTVMRSSGDLEGRKWKDDDGRRWSRRRKERGRERMIIDLEE